MKIGKSKWMAGLVLIFLLGFMVCIAIGKSKAELEVERLGEKAKAAEKLGEKGETSEKAEIKTKSKQELEIEQLNLPEDTSPSLAVKQIRISGNILVSTDILLKDIPLVYNSSDKPLHQAESSDLYDFRILRDIILNPGPPRQISTRTIEGFTQYLLSVYQSHGYSGVYVHVPAEAISADMELPDGQLPIEVVEITVSEIRISHYDVEGNKMEEGLLRSSVFQEWSPAKVGQVANKKKMDDFINLLNLNPDRYISATVSEGAAPRSLAIEYDIYEANPWHSFIQVDNSGTSQRQWAPRVGLINTNLTGIDDRFTAIYQAPWESGIEDNYSLFGSYDFPLLGPRLRLNLYGGYSEFDITPEAGLFNFLGRGSFYGGILRYNAFQKNGWFFDVTSSLGHEKSKVTPSLLPIAGSDVEMNLWGVGFDIHRRDDMSNTSFIFNRLQSFGGSGQSSFWDSATLTGARTNAERGFAIYTTSAYHSRFLDRNKVQRFSGSCRWITSDGRLVPAKMTSFGGLYSVRGYREYEIVADGGIIASAQYEFDLVKYEESQEIGETESNEEMQAEKPWLRKLAPLAFFDFGRARIQSPVAGERAVRELYSVGLGTVVELGDNFSGAVYYGFPLRPTDATSAGEGRFGFSFIYRF